VLLLLLLRRLLPLPRRGTLRQAEDEMRLVDGN
jgi:hypothetical protein